MISLGLRLHHQKLRYALVSHSKKNWECLESGAVKNSRLVLKQLSRKAHRIILGLSTSQVLTKTIETPLTQKKANVANHIQMNLPEWFGLHNEALQFDFVELKASAEQRRWQVVATRKSIVAQYQKALFNIKLDAIDVDLFALMRIAKRLVKTNSFIWAFNSGLDVLIFSVINGEQQRSLVLKSHLPAHLEQLRQNNEPIFLSGNFEGKVIHPSHYLDCIGLALWNTN